MTKHIQWNGTLSQEGYDILKGDGGCICLLYTSPAAWAISLMVTIRFNPFSLLSFHYTSKISKSQSRI